jgi:hypothetical protein
MSTSADPDEAVGVAATEMDVMALVPVAVLTVVAPYPEVTFRIALASTVTRFAI